MGLCVCVCKHTYGGLGVWLSNSFLDGGPRLCGCTYAELQSSAPGLAVGSASFKTSGAQNHICFSLWGQVWNDAHDVVRLITNNCWIDWCCSSICVEGCNQCRSSSFRILRKAIAKLKVCKAAVFWNITLSMWGDKVLLKHINLLTRLWPAALSWQAKRGTPRMHSSLP